MRYFMAFVAFLLLIVLGLIFVFSHHKGTPKKPAPIIRTLPDYAETNSAVSLTIDGIVNGDDLHRAIRITISRDYRTIDIIQGYSGRVIDSHTEYNTKDAYEVLLRALNTAGFTTRLKKVTGPNDYRGMCPEGTRDIFGLADNGEMKSSLWSSTCGIGTFGGNTELAQSIFQRQITNYDDITSQVEL